jgi:hypothetical protein
LPRESYRPYPFCRRNYRRCSRIHNIAHGYNDRLQHYANPYDYWRTGYTIGFTGESYEIVQGAFIENNVRYHYETLLSTGSGEMFYWVTLSDGRRIKKTEEEMKDFVKDIMKFISYKISNLSD